MDIWTLWWSWGAMGSNYYTPVPATLTLWGRKRDIQHPDSLEIETHQFGGELNIAVERRMQMQNELNITATFMRLKSEYCNKEFRAQFSLGRHVDQLALVPGFLQTSTTKVMRQDKKLEEAGRKKKEKKKRYTRNLNSRVKCPLFGDAWPWDCKNLADTLYLGGGMWESLGLKHLKEKSGLCGTCLDEMKEQHESAKQQFWDDLPHLFGLPDRPELENQEPHTLDVWDLEMAATCQPWSTMVIVDDYPVGGLDIGAKVGIGDN
ncbi:hypothetical protein C8R44DRAFT_724924 [Mycena epipterygia]|nr:hypothetical protein C8R44DRAFT_724924 [Mycena epipterygia]